MHYWLFGDQVVWRSRPQGHIGYVIPTTVVSDTATVTVLYQANGSICKRRNGHRDGPQGRNLSEKSWDGSHIDRIWTGPSTLRLHVWGSSYAIIRSWNFDMDCAQGWYINLEKGWRRTAIGFDSQDFVLDIRVADDRSSWIWKAEDELAWSVASGKYLPEEVEAIRSEGLRAIQALEAGIWPFQDDWSAWQPDINWPIAILPSKWDDKSL